jgi:hypothetical protein
VLAGLLKFFSGDLTRRTLLFVLVPLIFVFYFGTIAFAIFWYPESFDWRSSVISRLISPRNNPEFHSLPSLGIALTGLLMIPFAGYINRRLSHAAPFAATIGTFAFGTGVLWLILAGLIVSEGHRGASFLARLHEICARTAALGIGLGQLAFCSSAIKGHFVSGKKPYPRRLLIVWILLTLGPIVFLAAGQCLIWYDSAHLPWSNQIQPTLQRSLFWHLAFWEWIGSWAVFLFLLSSALYLPEQSSANPQK